MIMIEEIKLPTDARDWVKVYNTLTNEEIKEFFLLPLEDKEEFINNREKEQTNEKIRSENK